MAKVGTGQGVHIFSQRILLEFQSYITDLSIKQTVRQRVQHVASERLKDASAEQAREGAARGIS
jgi:hypothetical protein